MRAFLALFVLGLALRLGALLLFFPQDQIPPNANWEMGAVSISLATKGQLADPYLLPTGPTAHVPPLYPAAISLIYRVLGVGFWGGLVRWLLIIVACSLLWALMPSLGESFGLGRRAGILGGMAGTLFLMSFSEVNAFSALVLASLALAFYLRWKGIQKRGVQPRTSFLLGLAVGVTFHLQPVFLPVVLGYLAFEIWLWRGKSRWRPSVVMALGMALACLPWGVRNYATFHQLFFIRSNLGLELYVGNHDGAHADIGVSTARASFRHPRIDQEEAERVVELGEGAYMKAKKKEALDWIRAHPGEFMKLTATRALYFWAGPIHDFPGAAPYLLLTFLALVGAFRILPTMDPAQRAALFIPLGTYPLIYYLVAYMPSYGEPVRWVLFLLAAGAILGPNRTQRKPSLDI